MSVTSSTELSHFPEIVETSSIATSQSSLFGESREVEQVNIKEDLKTYRSFVSQERKQNWKKYLGTVVLGVAGLAFVFFGLVALNPFMIGVGLGLSMYSFYKYFKIEDKAKADALESFKLYDKIRLIKAQSSSQAILQTGEVVEQENGMVEDRNPLASKPVHSITFGNPPPINITSKEGRKKYDSYISKMRKKSWAQYLKSGVIGVSGVALIFFGSLALNPFMMGIGIGLTVYSFHTYWSTDDKAKADALEQYRKDEDLSYRQNQVMVLMKQTMLTIESRASQDANFSTESDSFSVEGTLVNDKDAAFEEAFLVDGETTPFYTDQDGLVNRTASLSLSLEQSD